MRRVKKGHLEAEAVFATLSGLMSKELLEDLRNQDRTPKWDEHTKTWTSVYRPDGEKGTSLIYRYI